MSVTILCTVVVSMSIYGLVGDRGRECVYAQERMISPVALHDKKICGSVMSSITPGPLV